MHALKFPMKYLRIDTARCSSNAEYTHSMSPLWSQMQMCKRTVKILDGKQMTPLLWQKIQTRNKRLAQWLMTVLRIMRWSGSIYDGKLWRWRRWPKCQWENGKEWKKIKEMNDVSTVRCWYWGFESQGSLPVVYVGILILLLFLIGNEICGRNQ